VGYWWAASKTAVQNWGRASGITRSNNEGTMRLMLAAAEKGAEAIQGREWSQEEREQRRRNAVEKNLAQHLITGYHGPRWTKQQLAMLGTMPDAEVAAKTGRTPSAVRIMRTRLGIANPFDGCRQRKAVSFA
jgi:hypothetical protein